ncbi:type II toxin-antitoxin system Phd/YefM family antitoxin [Bacteroides sp. 51]|uniref:type II toxin-antitoxin system Phd/YefM family antitoxin n=1 Tax=Bacteroides sp. 51 TaxID=2302938 RepID=UPI0013D1EE9D|nr:type II toxin-antitoxin system Phd/YefM family antitoxin [Bacteroides sp. 51]NDV80417.1 type II toxin-antitoxin system Phd/YefM family antitoxin [Bacteroides sp. 51]
MIVISSAELRNNLKKYLDLAKTQKVVIQRGKAETFVLTQEQYLQPDDNLAKGMTADELLAGIEADIQQLFRTKYRK